MRRDHYVAMEQWSRFAATAPPTYLFQYWVGGLTPVISFCQTTVEAHHPHRVLRFYSLPVACQDFYGITTKKFDALRPAHQADVVRAWVLMEVGGWWVDSDFLCFAQVDDLISGGAAVAKDFALYARPDRTPPYFDNDLLWAGKRSKAAEAYALEVRKYLRANSYTVREWADIGGELLTRLFRGNSSYNVYQMNAERISSLRRMANNWDAPLPEVGSLRRELPSDAVGVMLVNSLSGLYLGQRQATELMKERTVIGALLFHAAHRLPLMGS